MIDRIDKMLEDIVDRVETALPNATQIDKVATLGTLLVAIKQSFVEVKAIETTDLLEVKEEI